MMKSAISLTPSCCNGPKNNPGLVVNLPEIELPISVLLVVRGVKVTLHPAVQLLGVWDVELQAVLLADLAGFQVALEGRHVLALALEHAALGGRPHPLAPRPNPVV